MCVNICAIRGLLYCYTTHVVIATFYTVDMQGKAIAFAIGRGKGLGMEVHQWVPRQHPKWHLSRVRVGVTEDNSPLPKILGSLKIVRKYLSKNAKLNTENPPFC